MANQFNAPVLQYLDSSGNPLSGGLLYIYNTGTTTLTPIYSNSGLSVALTNPVVLNPSGYTSSDGATPCSIYWASGTAVKMKLASSTNSTIFTIDPVPGIDLLDLASFFTSANPLLTLKVDKTMNIAGGGTNLKLNGVSISTSIPDSLGVPILKFTTTTNAVNQITITDSVTGTAPIISSSGSDTNLGLTLAAKGTGSVNLGQATSTGVKLVADQPIVDSSGNALISFTKTVNAVNSLKVTNTATGTRPILGVSGDATRGLDINDSNGNILLSLPSTAAAVDYLSITNAVTGNPATVTLTALGSDSNINLNLVPKGTGSVKANGNALLTSINVQTFTSSGTYTPTAGMAYCEIELVGGGGAGGGVAGGASGACAGGGAGAGGYALKKVNAATIGASQTITIGAGGIGVSGNNPGGNGGTTSVGAIVSATGGNGGSGQSVQTGFSYGAVGGGGMGSGGDVNLGSGGGVAGISFGTTSAPAFGGLGGNSHYAGAGATSIAFANTVAGNAAGANTGGGGSGAASCSNASAAGGNGAAGLIIITEYIHS